MSCVNHLMKILMINKICAWGNMRNIQITFFLCEIINIQRRGSGHQNKTGNQKLFWKKIVNENYKMSVMFLDKQINIF